MLFRAPALDSTGATHPWICPVGLRGLRRTHTIVWDMIGQAHWKDIADIRQLALISPHLTHLRHLTLHAFETLSREAGAADYIVSSQRRCEPGAADYIVVLAAALTRESFAELTVLEIENSRFSHG